MGKTLTMVMMCMAATAALGVDYWGEAKSRAMPKEPSETMALLMEVLDRQLADPAVDVSRVYVTGISMGGYGTWDLACRRPEAFAAAMPICGSSSSAGIWAPTCKDGQSKV